MHDENIGQIWQCCRNCQRLLGARWSNIESGSIMAYRLVAFRVAISRERLASLNYSCVICVWEACYMVFDARNEVAARRELAQHLKTSPRSVAGMKAIAWWLLSAACAVCRMAFRSYLSNFWWRSCQRAAWAIASRLVIASFVVSREIMKMIIKW